MNDAQSWDDEPLVDTSARVGDVKIAEAYDEDSKGAIDICAYA